MNLFIAIPSRERAKRLDETIQSIKDTATGSVFIQVRIDDNDPQLQDYHQIAKKHNMTFHIGAPGKYCGLINEIYHTSFTSAHEAFLCGTDDFICQDKGWDETLANLNRERKYWLAWFDDEEKKTECAQLPILSTALVKYLGQPMYPLLEHFKGDKWLTDVAIRLQVAYYIPTHRMIHMTPKTGKGPVDNTFLRVRMGDQIVRDENAYTKSLIEMDNYLKTLDVAHVAAGGKSLLDK